MEKQWTKARCFRPGQQVGCCLVFALLLLGITTLAVSADDSTKGSRSSDTGPRLAFIDQLIEESWKKAGVKPAKPAGDDEFLRRAYLDLLGRIPNVQEARAFLQTHERDKRDKLVTYLLEHPDFAKNFATQWSILLIGRGNQGRRVDRASLTSWLRKQFASGRPWNEVVHELVSSTGSNKENGAVNYVLAHLEFEAVPLTSRTTRLFLGQQIQCTQCHDHPSNDWKQGDFWGINAFFRGMKIEEVRKADATGLEKSTIRNCRMYQPKELPVLIVATAWTSRVSEVPGRQEDQPGHRCDPPRRAGQTDLRPE